ncbi:lipid A biosynthesis acyltransferase [Blastopirellula marina]|uniref:Lipid A biosynthesis acyltransferase n=1 Tax=Blastopirellula marina TaxID=124 RepID=A0A2S8FT05_9BACT|nr:MULTISPECIES: lysophospholipid acyltransferase family protein [Pirellulaceae]PQO35313.1 lipid A biosynthesis acyltransferase [Blastopirellula marina]RCS53182.1 lipid A biosynthesis acyltransferase [Bremerella cremea]
MRPKLVVDYLVYLIVRLFICTVQATPLSVCAQVSKFLAWLASDVLKIRGKLVDSNLAHAFPELSPPERKKLARRSWYHLCLMVCEIAHAPRKLHDTNWHKHITMRNIHIQIEQALGRRPVVVLLGHFGNFEVMGYCTGMLGFPTYTVARPLDNPFLHKWLEEFRSSTGQIILPKQGSAPYIEQVLNQNGTLALLCDQNAGPKGCWVEFMNRPASYHKAISVFSMTSGAPLVFLYMRRTGGPMQFEFGVEGIYDPATASEAKGVKEVTQWYNEMLERVVRRDPEQYWWVHNRWKDERPAKKREQEAKRLAAEKVAAAA